MVRTFLKVYMELGSYFLFLQEQIKDIIIIIIIMSPSTSILPWPVLLTQAKKKCDPYFGPDLNLT